MERITFEDFLGLIKPNYLVNLGSVHGINYDIIPSLPSHAKYITQFALKPVPKYHTTHLGPTDRKGQNDYIPMSFSLRQHHDQYSDIMAINVNETNKAYFNLGPTVTSQISALGNAKIKVALLNKNLPITVGESNVLKSYFDYVVTDAPMNKLVNIPNEPSDQVTDSICDNILNLVDNTFPTLQLGVGTLPNEILSRLALTRQRVNIYSEAIGDSALYIDTYTPIRYSVAFGTDTLYDELNNNEWYHIMDIGNINSIPNIARQPSMTSINQALQVDLFGNVSSESIGTKQISGTGGALDFVIGSQYAHKGKSIITLPSTRMVNGQLYSNIVLEFEPFTQVTIPRSLTHYVCTEYGIVNLRGLSLSERIQAMISIAHPQFKDILWFKAKKVYNQYSNI